MNRYGSYYSTDEDSETYENHVGLVCRFVYIPDYGRCFFDIRISSLQGHGISAVKFRLGENRN